MNENDLQAYLFDRDPLYAAMFDEFPETVYVTMMDGQTAAAYLGMRPDYFRSER